MASILRRVYPVAGICIGAFAVAVSLRSWEGERSFARGRAAQERGDLRGAAVEYRAALDRGRGNAAVALARLAFWNRDLEGARKLIREAMTLLPAQGYPHIFEASLISAGPGSWDRAREDRVLESCRVAVSINPADPKLWKEYGDIALNLYARRHGTWDAGRIVSVLDDVAQAYGEAFRWDPGQVRPLLADVLKIGMEPAFLVRVAADTGDESAIKEAVELLAGKGLWQRAEMDYWGRAETDDSLRIYCLAAVDALERQGRFREALAAARRGLEALPGDVEIAFRSAEIALRLPNQEALEAVPLFRYALDRAPGDVRRRKIFTNFLLKQGLLTEAESQARAVVAADPADAETWNRLGEILSRAGRREEARTAFRKAAGLRPDVAAYRLVAGD